MALSGIQGFIAQADSLLNELVDESHKEKPFNVIIIILDGQFLLQFVTIYDNLWQYLCINPMSHY